MTKPLKNKFGFNRNSHCKVQRLAKKMPFLYSGDIHRKLMFKKRNEERHTQFKGKIMKSWLLEV